MRGKPADDHLARRVIPEKVEAEAIAGFSAVALFQVPVQFDAPLSHPDEIRVALFPGAVPSEGLLFFYAEFLAALIKRLPEVRSAVPAHGNIVVAQEQKGLVDDRNVLVFRVLRAP